jgi:hypothetical protein
MGFPNVVTVQNAFGIPGELYDDSPERSAPWTLNSASASYNLIGSTAFTALTADPGNAYSSGTAKAGGTGQFCGILTGPKQYATQGPSTGPLDPSLVLPNQVIGQLTTMGHLIVVLPGPANLGDSVCYDTTTGALASFAKTTSFTATLNATTGVLAVSAITAGAIVPGMTIATGTGAAGVVITGYDGSYGGTGNYYTNYAGNGGGNISSTVMTAASLPPPATSFTASIATTGVMTVSAVGSGEILPGQVLAGTNVPANTVVQPYGTGGTSGEGNTGTYQVTPAPAVAVTSTTVTADAQTAIPRAEVILFQPAGNGGLAVISLTNA